MSLMERPHQTNCVSLMERRQFLRIYQAGQFNDCSAIDRNLTNNEDAIMKNIDTKFYELKAMECLKREYRAELELHRRQLQSEWKRPSNNLEKSTRNPPVKKTKTGFIHR